MSKGVGVLKPLSVLCALLAATAVLCRAQEQAAPPEAAAESTVIDANEPPPHKPILKRLVSFEAVTATLPGAVIQQFHDWPAEWGKQRKGFEKRAASLYGQFVIGLGIEAGVKAIHSEDTHYRRRAYGNFFGRSGYAIVHTLLARGADGRLTPAYSMAANAYGSWAVATLWSPREYRNVPSIFEWGSSGVGVAAATNVVREFWPDFKGLFHRKATTSPTASLSATFEP